MNISGPDAESGGIRIPKQTQSAQHQSSSKHGATRNADLHGGELSTRLAAVMEDRGVTVSPALVRELYGELSALGFKGGDIDETAILNALLLRRYGIPLSKELIESLRGNLPSVLREMAGLRETASTFLGDSRLTGEIRTAIEILIRDLDAFFRGTIRQNIVSAGMSDEAAAAPLRNLIHNSGLAFEWQLWAWYRSGRDPERLRVLLNDDLKGVLIAFTNRVKKHDSRGVLKKKLAALTKDIETHIKNIEHQQISNILGRHEQKKGFCFELPPGGYLNTGRGTVTNDGDGDSNLRGNNSEPKPFTVELDIDTTCLGTVHVTLTFAGNDNRAVALSFELGNGSVLEEATRMSGELREKLAARGYTVVSVDFQRFGDSSVQHAKDSSSENRHERNQNLDITG